MALENADGIFRAFHSTDVKNTYTLEQSMTDRSPRKNDFGSDFESPGEPRAVRHVIVILSEGGCNESQVVPRNDRCADSCTGEIGGGAGTDFLPSGVGESSGRTRARETGRGKLPGVDAQF
jgi:hypothetical protein